MKKIKLILKATVFCLAAVLSMGVAQATTNLLYNYSFELPGTGKITSGYDTIPGWFSANPSPPTTPDTGIQTNEDAPDGIFGPYNPNNYDAYTKESDGYHVRQTTGHLIQQGECFLVSVWSKNEFVHTLGWGPTDGYLTMVLYYGGTSDVVGVTNNIQYNVSLGTVGTPFFTNTFVIHPGQGSHTVTTDWTNYLFGVITNSIPTNAIGQLLGVDIWQSSAEYNPNAYSSQCWLDFDAPSVVGTNGIPPIASPVVFSPTNRVFGGETLTIAENCFGSLPLTYQWQTDGGGGGSLTNIIGATSTNLVVVTTTNAGTYNYVIIITNSYGSITSAAASYTVRGLAGPVITQDTGTADFGTITNIFGFINGNVNLYAAFDGAPLVTNQWSVKLDSGGGYAPIAGATNDLEIFNVLSGSAGYYRLGATNAYGYSNSTPAHLVPLADPGAPTAINTYAYGVLTNFPWAYWRFEETNDTFTHSMQAYDYSGHNFDATYGNRTAGGAGGCRDGGESSINNQVGPTPMVNSHPSYPGFETTNGCAQLGYNIPNGYLTVPPLNLNTNTVTFTMWLFANSDVVAVNSGLFMNRNGGDSAGVGFGSGLDVNQATSRSMAELGYTWSSNSATTYGFHSKLYLVSQIWSFAAWVITPTNTTIYLYYVSGGKTNLFKATQVGIVNTPEAFSGGITRMGGDSNNGDGGTFDGSIDEVAVFTNSLSETQIQGLFLKSIGLFTGVAPGFTLQPTNNTVVFRGQVLQIPALAGGIPSPNYQWQLLAGTTWANANNSILTGIYGATNATFGWTNYAGAYTSFRCIAKNSYGSVTSTVATVTIIPVPTNGLWTVNFSVISTNNGGTGLPYSGRGVLGANNYWNALSGSQLSSTTSYQDDGITVSGISLGSTGYPGSFSSLAGLAFDNALLDTFAQISGTNAFVFRHVPNGKYNLALYGCVGSYVNRGITFTVFTNGVSAGTQSVTNVQDISFLPDNTVIYTNLLVLSGSLEVDMTPVLSTPLNLTNSTEGDFNGAQLQLVKLAPSAIITNNGSQFVLSWSGGGLYSSTNVMPGPWWVTNPAVSPYTIAPTGAMRFFRIYNPTWPN